MGIFCVKQLDIVEKIKCDKCNDYYQPHYGGYSKRNSCRVHQYKDGICQKCHNDYMTEINCYHYNLNLIYDY